MNERVYAEVRCDYFNEEENCWYVDAWKSDDDNEEGRSLAAINGTTGDVFYIDKSAWDLKEVREVIDEKRKEILSKPIRMSLDVLTSFNEDTKFANLYFNTMGCNFEEDDKPSIDAILYNEIFNKLSGFVKDLDAFDDFIREEVTASMNEETIKTKFFKRFESFSE